MRCIVKRFCLGLATMVFALVAFASTLRLTAPRAEPRYCGNAFDRIQLGMTQPEVEKVFGGPEGNYNVGPFVGPSCGVGLPIKSDGRNSSVKWLIWTYDDAEVIIGLAANGQVVSVKSTPNVYGTGKRPSFFDVLRGFLKTIF